jgi:hypothetical protein
VHLREKTFDAFRETSQRPLLQDLDVVLQVLRRDVLFLVKVA